ncbi:RABE1 protein, partial [Semnornis frantzii]|nr:RABE1 protein [Semnornis frantzii]
EDLKRQKVVLQAGQDGLGQLRAQLLSSNLADSMMEAQAEMENIKAIAAGSETPKQEDIDEAKRQWQEAATSLQAIIKETVGDCG